MTLFRIERTSSNNRLQKTDVLYLRHRFPATNPNSSGRADGSAAQTGYLLCLSARFVGRPALPICANRGDFIAIAHPSRDLAIPE
jgi:hypothetical protein